MNEVRMYQKAMTEKAELVISSLAAIREYADRLLFKKCVAILRKWQGECKYIEKYKCNFMVVEAGHAFYDHWWRDDNFREQAARLRILLIRDDIKQILDDKKRKLTDTERKVLKDIEKMRTESIGWARLSRRMGIRNTESNQWRYIERMEGQLKRLEEMKSKIVAGFILEWPYNFNELIDENFMNIPVYDEDRFGYFSQDNEDNDDEL